MRRLGIVGIALLWVVALSSTGLTQEEATAELSFKEQFKQQLDQWLPGMDAEKIPDRRDSQQKLQVVCLQLGTPGREVERAEACEVIAETLRTKLAGPARIWLLKQLEFIGRTECVDAVAASLDDPDRHVRDAARRALQNNPAPEAGAKLQARLSGAGGSWRVGLINSLGARADQASVAALAGLLGGQDQAAAAAAANALGRIGGPEATKALSAALPGAPDQLKARMADAYLRCADKLLASGKRNEAAAIYKELYTAESPGVIRLAALQGMLNAAGSGATAMILQRLASEDPHERAIAAGQVENVLGTGVLRTSEQAFSGLSPSAKVLLLAALAVQGDKSLVSVAVAAAESGDQNVRLAGIRALGPLGDASVVPGLVKALTSGGSQRDAARESLQRLAASGVDEAILETLKDTDPGLRRTLIEVLDARKAMLAVPILLKEAEHQDAGVRSQAVRALGNLAESKHVSAMIKLLLKTEKGRQRDDTEKAIMFVCNRIPQAEQRADPVIAELSQAGDEDRCVLLPLVGRIGGPKALDAIHAAMLEATKPDVSEAGVRALCNWPDASVADELLMNAKISEIETYRLWALRAYVRVITLPSDRRPKETLVMLKEAMDLATQDDERRLILSRAASARCVETLRWVARCLDDRGLAAEAGRTVVELAHHRELREPNKAEFDKALQKVIQIAKDRDLVDRARRYMEGL